MKIRKILLGLSVFAGLAALCWYLGTILTPQRLQAWLCGWGSWAAIGYIGLFTVLPAFFFPVAVLALAGGVLFGLWWGSVYTFLGAMLNCSLMFWMARNLGRKQIEALIQKRLSPVWQRRIQSLEGRTGFLVLILLRLIPAVPYNLINYAFGLTAMPFRVYLLASAMGIIPGTLAFINIGDKALDVTIPDFWIAMGLLGLLLVVTAVLGKKIFPKENRLENEQ